MVKIKDTGCKIGIAGIGAIGGAVAKRLIDGIDGYELTAISSRKTSVDCPCPNVDFETLCQSVDLVIEALPPADAPELIRTALKHKKDLIIISACALLSEPALLDQIRTANSRTFVPSGALSSIDGVSALKQLGIKSASIATTKKPSGYKGAPFIKDNNIDLDALTEKTMLFSGNALDAAKGFPANVNVAATLSLAGIGAQNTQVQIWADPKIDGNCHEIMVQGEFSTIETRIKNTPDPQNPKSSMLAAQSIIATLLKQTEPLRIG